MCSYPDGSIDNDEAESEAQTSMRNRKTARHVKTNKSKYNMDIIEQLSAFGYTRHEIIFAMSTVSDANDINEIKLTLDAMINEEHLNGMNGQNGANGHYDFV